MTDEGRQREQICKWGRSLFERGLSSGSSGNISARVEDGSILATPTDASLGFLDPERLSKLDPSGTLISGDPPTKEVPLHLGFYDGRPAARGIVHLHSTYATALSCCRDLDPHDAVPPITPYVVMKIGRVPVLPYAMPGSDILRPLIASVARNSNAVLIANHGPVVSGVTFEDAVFAAEELEEAAKLTLISRGLPISLLSTGDLNDLEKTFGRRRKGMQAMPR